MTRTLSSLFGDAPHADLGSHIAANCVAGSGKTTTIADGYRRSHGITPKINNPTTQQLQLWTAIGHFGGTKGLSYLNTVADAIQEQRIPGTTMHKSGMSMLFGLFGGRKFKVEQKKTVNVVAAILDTTPGRLYRSRPGWIPAVRQMVSMCKIHLLRRPSDKALEKLQRRFTIGVGSKDGDLIREVLKRSLDPSSCVVDFDDMLCWPYFHELTPKKKFDTAWIDEAQDLNKAQHDLAFRMGHRIIAVGDNFQQCMSFAGSLSDSFPRLVKRLSESQRGCQELRLTTSFRCSQAVAEVARQFVPEFEVPESNVEGAVSDIQYGEMFSTLRPDDRVVCRTNAPLIKLAFELLKDGRPASVMGRDIGAQLLVSLDMLAQKYNLNDHSNSERFCQALNGWESKELARAREDLDNGRAIYIEDQAGCLRLFAGSCKTVGAIRRELGNLFTESGSPIWLGSIHRTKGREAERVFILRPDLLPHPMAEAGWEREIERNLEYVAVTRSSDLLFYVKGG